MDIFVAKLSSETSADNLTELFSQFGTVKSSKIIMDRETGISKCYGFVEIKNEGEAASAIEFLNNTKFMGNFVAKKSEPHPQAKRSQNTKSNKGFSHQSDSNRHFHTRNRKQDEGRSLEKDQGFNRYN